MISPEASRRFSLSIYHGDGYQGHGGICTGAGVMGKMQKRAIFLPRSSSECKMQKQQRKERNRREVDEINEV